MTKDINDLNQDDRIPYPVRLLSIEGACQYLSCSGDMLEELISIEEIPIVRLGREPKGCRDRRKRWIDRFDLDKLIEKKKHHVNGN